MIGRVGGGGRVEGGWKWPADDNQSERQDRKTITTAVGSSKQENGKKLGLMGGREEEEEGEEGEGHLCAQSRVFPSPPPPQKEREREKS